MQAPQEASLKALGSQAVPAPKVVSSFSRLPCGVSLTPKNTRPRGTVLPPTPRLGQGSWRAVGAGGFFPPWSVASGAGCRSEGWPGLGLDAPPGRHAHPSEQGCFGAATTGDRRVLASVSAAHITPGRPLAMPGVMGRGLGTRPGDQLQTEEGRGPARGSWGRADRL